MLYENSCKSYLGRRIYEGTNQKSLPLFGIALEGLGQIHAEIYRILSHNPQHTFPSKQRQIKLNVYHISS